MELYWFYWLQLLRSKLQGDDKCVPGSIFFLSANGCTAKPVISLQGPPSAMHSSTLGWTCTVPCGADKRLRVAFMFSACQRAEELLGHCAPLTLWLDWCLMVGGAELIIKSHLPRIYVGSERMWIFSRLGLDINAPLVVWGSPPSSSIAVWNGVGWEPCNLYVPLGLCMSGGCMLAGGILNSWHRWVMGC